MKEVSVHWAAMTIPSIQYNTIREECRLSVFENRILRRIFGSKRMRMGSGEGSTMRDFIVCTVDLI